MTERQSMASRFTRFVIVVAVAGGLVNLGGELAVPAESRSVRAHSSGTLGGLLPEEQEHVRERYQLYGQLRDLAAGGTIVVPRDLLDTATLRFLSGMEVERSADRRRVSEAALRRLPDTVRYREVTEPTVGSGELFPYVVAVSATNPDRLLTYVTRRSNTILIVDPVTAAAMELP
jgi:hypothetical protein